MGMLDFQSFWNFGEMNSLQETGRNHALPGLNQQML
jgi:hypothetical protein